MANTGKYSVARKPYVEYYGYSHDRYEGIHNKKRIRFYIPKGYLALVGSVKNPTCSQVERLLIQHGLEKQAYSPEGGRYTASWKEKASSFDETVFRSYIFKPSR
tara:strand:+ start:626 stop:937 length:312 start_codon:yes stop_codon:yes gene_type:complete